MKKIISVFLITIFLIGSLMCIPTENAIASDASSYIEDALRSVIDAQSGNVKKSAFDSVLIDYFVDYSSRLRSASYADIESELRKTGLKYKSTKPTSSKFGSHHVYDNNVELYFGYYPVNSSLNSKDFGNINKEMLCSLELSYGELSISVSNSMHTKGITYTTHDPSRTPVNETVISLSRLLSFYENTMGGAIHDNGSKKHTNQDEITDSGIKSIIERRATQEYFYTQIDSVEINYCSVDSMGQNRVVIVKGKWTGKSTKNVAENIKIFSDDMAAWLHKNSDVVAELYVFWTVPAIHKSNTAAKYTYHFYNHGAVCTNTSGYLVK